MTHEDELIMKIEQGDGDALNELVSTYYPEILRYCLYHAPNRSMAEDATQETFLKAIRYLNRYIHKGKFKAFLYQIATNTCIDMQRKKGLSNTSLDEIPLIFPSEDFLALQIKFIGLKIWLIQGLILAALCYIITIRFGNDLYCSKRYAAVFICEISVMVLMTSVPFIKRSLHHKMHEQEMASYFSSVKLIAAKLIIIGIGDIFILNGMLFLIVFKNYLNIGSALLYAVFTILFTGCALMYLLGHIPAQWFSPCCLGLCAALFIGIKLLNRLFPAFFGQSFSIPWICVCLTLLLLCLSQLRYIMHCSSYAKIQFE